MKEPLTCWNKKKTFWKGTKSVLKRKCKTYLFVLGHSRPLFRFFRSFYKTLRTMNCRLTEIRIRIVRVEAEHAEHLTTPTTNVFCLVYTGR